MSLLGKCLKVCVYQEKELNEVMSGGKMRNDPKAATNKWGSSLSLLSFLFLAFN